MDVKLGNEIRVDGRHIDDRPRRGEIVEIMTSDGREPYRVRLFDGSDSLFFPGSEAHIAHRESPSWP